MTGKKVELRKYNLFVNFIGFFLLYMLLPFFFMLDIVVEIYHQLGFRLYKMKKVRRSTYIVLDRQKLSYLSALQKINCVYCGYANGLLGYVSEIAARTEEYWCPIKHNVPTYSAHHKNFAEYGDESQFKKRYDTAIFK